MKFLSYLALSVLSLSSSTYALERPTPLSVQEDRGTAYFYGPAASASNNDWRGYVGSPATLSLPNEKLPFVKNEGRGSLEITTTLPSGGWWNTMFFVSGGQACNWAAEAGNTGVLALRVRRATGDASFKVQIGDWGNTFSTTNNSQTAILDLADYGTLTNQWQTISIPIADFKAANPAIDMARINWVQFIGTGNYATSSTIYLEELLVREHADGLNRRLIRVDQIGYLPDAEKISILGYEVGGIGAISPSSLTFEVLDTLTGSTVSTGKWTRIQGEGSDWDKSGDTVYEADFSSVTSPGTYVIRCPQLAQQSEPFSISNKVYGKPWRDALRYFYYSRSGQRIEEPYAEGHTRDDDYLGDTAATWVSGAAGTRDVSGGFYDAGDLHKDMHPQLRTSWLLLEALRLYSDKVPAGFLNLPESGTTASDLLPLVKWQLDWMERMWNSDGSVLYWVVSPPPYQNSGPGKVSGISSAAASNLAGGFAKAYMVIKDIPGMETYADSLLAKAEKSWEWLAANPGNINPVNPAGGIFGYEPNNLDETAYRFTAAMLLYNATGKQIYLDYVNSHISNPLTDFNNQAWGGITWSMNQNPVNIAYLEYINSSRAVDESKRTQFKALYKTMADWLVAKMVNPYRPPILGANHMFWGSTGGAAGNALHALYAYEWYGDEKYKTAALDCMHWNNGRNPSGWSMISGNGTRSTPIYSFFWLPGSNVPPGYVAGGINENEFSMVEPYLWKRFNMTHGAPHMEPTLHWNAEAALLYGYFASVPDDLVSHSNVVKSTAVSTLKVRMWGKHLNISISVPTAGNCRAELFDLRGRQLMTLINKPLSSGIHSIDTDMQSTGIASGQYILRVTTAGQVMSERVFLAQ